ncbi:MAG: histidine kinase, partial [Bacteroidota bacterium]
LSALVLLLAIAFFVGFYRQRKLKNEALISNMQHRMLRLQMNPHFIFNVLTAIQNYQLRGDSRQAGIFLARFGKVIRKALEYSREEFITLKEEKELLEDYLEVQRSLNNESFEYEIKMPGDLDPGQIKVPPMFAQPFIENAIEHGDLGGVTNGKVEIAFERQGGLLQLKINDNGVGMKKTTDADKSKKSLSTIITRERLTLLEKRFGQSLRLNHLDNEGGDGTTVELALPFIQQ